MIDWIYPMIAVADVLALGGVFLWGGGWTDRRHL